MLSIIIPTRDKATRLRLCLRALAAAFGATGIAGEVVVVDDGATDMTAAVCDAARSIMPVPVHRIRHDAPRGRSRARNLGAAEAGGEQFLFLDDDILLSPEALRGHAATHRPGRQVLVRGTILNLPWLRPLRDPTGCDADTPPGVARRRFTDGPAEELLSHAARYARRSAFEADLHRLLAGRPNTARGRWPGATGGNLSVPASFFHTLGGFDEAMGLRWGLEDLEFGLRAEQAGAAVIHLAGVVVYHMDHKVAGRAADHQAALDYFALKHGEALAGRLAAYFSGVLALKRLVDG